MFETALAGHPAPHRRSVAGPLSVTLHLAVLAAIAIGSAWRISDPGEPNVRILFLPTPPPPAAGSPGLPAERPESPKPGAGRRIAAPLARFVAPAAIPVRIDAAPVAAPLGTAPVAASPGSGPGATDGVEGGTGDSPFPGVGDGGPISATAPNVVPPRLLSQAQPEYPEAARRARLQGIVLLQAVIGTGGDVEDVRVVSSASPLFAEAAIRAVRQWRYVPAMLDRRAVRVYLAVTIQFALR
ncbi:MAG TPA: TonB family protein [Thermoanaerobaculia bacterium]|nr:TonB family protein [Thermoanaerobaculia bacterium]